MCADTLIDRRFLGAALAVLAVLLLAAPSSEAQVSRKKSIWGPPHLGAQSMFPTYADLGAGIYQFGLEWQTVAPTQPADPKNPSDPAYRWNPDVDYAINEGAKYGIEVSVLITFSPSWANGGQGPSGAPDPKHVADFAAAASRRYPGVTHWQILGEPTLRAHFSPLSKKRGPRRYAKILDAAYGALKGVDRADKVISGSSVTRGDVKPADWIRNLRLPNGKPPRMDLYGHNPFSPRKPNLKRKPEKKGQYDISDLDTMLADIDEHLREGKRNRKLRVFISEWTIPTDHADLRYGFYGDQVTVANHLSRALRIARRVKRVYTLGWFTLFDEPPNGAGTQTNWGLITANFVKKPAYAAFKAG